MNALLIPLRPEPDPHAEVFCEKCAGEITGVDLVQCPRCEMSWHDRCFWSPEHELCLDCLLIEADRRERLERDLECWPEIVRERLVKGRLL